MITIFMKQDRVTIHHDGEVFFNGKKVGVKQWAFDPLRWSDLNGNELKDYAGMSLEEVLKIRGFI